MSIALAIQKNTPSLALAQNTYKKNIVAVNTMVTSVLTSKLPSLSQQPPDWADFVANYEKASAEALDWVNQVMARLLHVPDEVKNYNNLTNQDLQSAKKQVEKLIDNPHDKTAMEALKKALSELSDVFSLLPVYITTAIAALQNFKGKLPKMADQLHTIAEKSTADAKADKKQISELNDDVQKLYDDLADLARQLMVLAIADGAALTLGLVATIAAWPEGLVAWLFVAPAVAAATTFIALDVVKAVEDHKKIEAKKIEIKGLTADVATLNLLAANYGRMAKESESIEGNLKAVLNEWQNLQRDVNAFITDLKKALADTTPPNFNAILDDLNNAIKEWNITYTQAGRLDIDLKVNNASLQIGQSSSQVKDALAGGQTFDLIEYYNHVMNAV